MLMLLQEMNGRVLGMICKFKFYNEGEDNANGYKSKREYKMAIG